MKLARMRREAIEFQQTFGCLLTFTLITACPQPSLSGPVGEINNLFPKQNPISNPWNTPSRKPAAFCSLYYVETVVHVGVGTNSHNLAMVLWWDTEKSVWHAESNWVSRVWCSLSISLMPLVLAANRKLNALHNMKQDHRCIWKQHVFNLQEIRSNQSCTKAVFTRISTDACVKNNDWCVRKCRSRGLIITWETCSVMTLALFVLLLALISVACSQHVYGIAGAPHTRKKKKKMQISSASLSWVSVDGAIGFSSAAGNISSGIQKPTGPD